MNRPLRRLRRRVWYILVNLFISIIAPGCGVTVRHVGPTPGAINRAPTPPGLRFARPSFLNHSKKCQGEREEAPVTRATFVAFICVLLHDFACHTSVFSPDSSLPCGSWL